MSAPGPLCHTHSVLANRCRARQGVAWVGQGTPVTRQCRCQAGDAGAVGAGGAGAAAGGDGRCRPGERHVQGGGWHRAGCPGDEEGRAGPPLTQSGAQVREELERRTGHSLAEHKDFIDNEMLLVLAQMDRPSRVFPHLFLVGSGAGGLGRAGGSVPSPHRCPRTGLRVERGQPGGAAAESVSSGWHCRGVVAWGRRGVVPGCHSCPRRVTHILNVAREIDNFFPALFTYMNVRVYDEEVAELLPHWNDTFLFLSRVRSVATGVTPQGTSGAQRGRQEGDRGVLMTEVLGCSGS